VWKDSFKVHLARLTPYMNFLLKVFSGIAEFSKRSRLVRKISGPDFKWHLKTGQKNRPKDDHSNTGLSGIRRGTVFGLILEQPSLQLVDNCKCEAFPFPRYRNFAGSDRIENCNSRTWSILVQNSEFLFFVKKKCSPHPQPTPSKENSCKE
jgi:hypothetical protein